MLPSSPLEVQVGGGAEVFAESLGDPDDPAILLIGGAGWSLDWWDDEFCALLVERGLRVVRYDNRDTGESTTYPPGEPGYGVDDVVADALAVLDAFGIERAHVAGLSMGGGIALLLGLDHRDRVAGLTLIATSSVAPGADGLPGPTPELLATFGDEDEPDWSDRDAVIEHVLEGERPYAGPGNFDEERTRAIAARVVDRSSDMAASLRNHFLIEGGDDVRHRLGELVGMPVLVVHGTADPLMPLAHGQALADEIPGARLIALEDAGHQLPPRPTWNRVVSAIAEQSR